MSRSIPKFAWSITGSSAARDALRQRKQRSADFFPPTETEVLDWLPGVAKSRKGRRAIKRQLLRVRRREGNLSNAS